MAEMLLWEALRRAQDEEMANDPLVIVMGEDVGKAGGTYKATRDFGTSTVRSASLTRLSLKVPYRSCDRCVVPGRPVVEIMSVNFAWLADQLFNTAQGALHEWRAARSTGGHALPGGTAHRLGLQRPDGKGLHGHRRTACRHAIHPKQAYGLLAAIRCNDPVFINEHERMYGLKRSAR